METRRDRRGRLAEEDTVNGIDFVEVVSGWGQTRLRVHFVNDSPGVAALAAVIRMATITGGESIPTVAATLVRWGPAAERPWLELAVTAPGDFSTYTLRLLPETPLLDPFFDRVTFSFKADCPSDFDCEAPGPECPPQLANTPPIDYLAKDFLSFRKALSDFSTLRYPAWQERSEADFGVMFMESLASLADDLSYLQDRIAAEAWLETATERRSLVRLARLVDYEPRAASAARVWLVFEMAAPGNGSIPAGVAVSGQAPDGTPVDFETGTGLDDEGSYPARPEWNPMHPYWWDDGQRCLPPGTTGMWIKVPGSPLLPGQRLLIDTTADPQADPPVREIVTLVSVGPPTTDRLFGADVVQITWRDEDALRSAHDLTRTIVRGNLVPATEGRRATDRFVTSRQPWVAGALPRAIVRTGANGSLQFLHTLQRGPLAWLAQENPAERPRPELHLYEVSDGRRRWPFRRSLLDATVDRKVVTVDPIRYRATDVAIGATEYDGEDGHTIRFGDGVFGATPADGAVFEVVYRCGGGVRGNVAAGSISRVDPAHPVSASIASVTNPLPGTGGRDQESSEKVRELAPYAYQATPYRAVRREDYEQWAMTLPGVQQAGTTFRYTGSWLTVFTALDPVGRETLPPKLAGNVTDRLNRRRLAGYESFVVPPRYASLDIWVTVCARPDAFRGDVKRAVLVALEATPHVDGTRGFFHPDRFTFGMGVKRSALEAAVQAAPGVDGVVDVRYRRRGHTQGFVAMPDLILVGQSEIVRAENNPSTPDRGSLRVDVVGGK
jgi:hypothetical protein